MIDNWGISKDHVNSISVENYGRRQEGTYAHYFHLWNEARLMSLKTLHSIKPTTSFTMAFAWLCPRDCTEGMSNYIVFTLIDGVELYCHM
jgi:hypothetical protein